MPGWTKPPSCRIFPLIIIMLDGRKFEKDARPRTPLMDDAALDQLADRLDAMGAEFLLVTSPDEVPLCLNDL